jgi:hypothetical protein
VADYSAGLQIIDVSRPSSPRLLSTVPAGSGGYAQGVALSGGTAFVATNSGLQIIDVSNPSHPQLLSTVSAGFGSAQGVALSGGTAFVADGTGLQIIDVSNPSHPQLLSTVPAGFGGAAQGVALSGGTAFVADRNAGLQIIDVSMPSSPRLLSTVPAGFGGLTDGVVISGNTAFVTDWYAGLQIIDLTPWRLTLTPGVADVGNYHVQITAIDALGGSTSTQPFTIRVEGPPQLKGSISLQRAWVGQPFTYFVPPDLFVDPNNDVMSYSASLISGKSLPNWLHFNPLNVGFGGVPQRGDWGNVTVTLSATDHICPKIPTVNFTISVGFLPVLSRRIPNQLAPIGLPYRFTVPKNSFFDPAGLVLSYLAQGAGNQLLPSWLQFNSTSLMFFGIADTSNITVYTLQFVATNSVGAQAITSFMLRTDHFPVFNNKILLPLPARVNQPWVWTVSNDAFTDADGDLLTYSAMQGDGSMLPSWLSFNPITHTFTGVPLLSGYQTLKISAQDSYGGSNRTYFNMTILPESQSGSVITLPSVRAGKSFVFEVPQNSFGINGTFNYSVALTNGEKLPSWLRFIASNLSFSGIPSSLDVGSYDITMTATDSQNIHHNVSFLLNVNSNYPPQVYLPISNQVAQVGEAFVFYASRQTFIDPNGDNLTYTVNLLPSWLSFDPGQNKILRHARSE